MREYPLTVWELAERYYSPLCVEVDSAGKVCQLWGDAERYGYTELALGVELVDVAPELHGFEFEAGESEHLWPFLMTPAGVSAHCCIKKNEQGYLVIWFAAQQEYAEKQQIQQIANDVRILEYRRQQLLTELQAVQKRLSEAG
jgi:hypothetical protein